MVIVSTSVPPAPSGQANVIANLTKRLSPEKCVFVTDDPSTHLEPTSFADLKRLPAASFDILKVDAGNIYKEVFNLIRARSTRLIQLFGKNRPDVLVACSGNLFDIPACAIASKVMNVPLVVYLFDDCVMQWRPGGARRIAKFLERGWSKFASAVVVPNESLADQFQSRTQIRPVVIRNPIASAFFDRDEQQSCNFSSPTKRIVYTGSIYWAQADAIKNILSCIERFNGQYELHIYAAQDHNVFESLGITSKYLVHHSYTDPERMPDLQRSADILFLPLSFDGTMRHLIVSSSPQKMGEYLTSGRPILVHAPEDAFVCKFYNGRECGTVVSENSIDALHEALRFMSSNNSKIELMIANAQMASAEFDGAQSERQFLDLLNSIGFDARFGEELSFIRGSKDAVRQVHIL